jgi:hypothetical protein
VLEASSQLRLHDRPISTYVYLAEEGSYLKYIPPYTGGNFLFKTTAGKEHYHLFLLYSVCSTLCWVCVPSLASLSVTTRKRVPGAYWLSRGKKGYFLPYGNRRIKEGGG